MITIKSKTDLNKATMAELLAYYNHHADAPIKRFSDRKAAMRRVAKLIEETLGKKLLDGKPQQAAKNVAAALAKRPMTPPAQRAEHKTRSAAIGDTWKDPVVRELRSARHKVEVDGEVYGSVRKAFVELGLPLEKHIKFRGELREAGEASAFGHSWKMLT